MLFKGGLGLEKDVTRLSTNQIVFKNDTGSVSVSSMFDVNLGACTVIRMRLVI